MTSIPQTQSRQVGVTSARQPRRRALGSTGLEVSVAALGGRDFSPPGLDRGEMSSILSAALDLGVNFVDTANVYGRAHGEAEAAIGEVLGSRRDEVILATKFAMRGGSVARHVRQQCEESLRRLATDHIDLYQVHFARDGVNAVDLLGELNALVEEGKVRAIGACNFSAWRLSEAAHLTNARDWRTFATVQSTYHLLARHLEAEVMPYAARTGMSMVAYRALVPAGSDVYSGRHGEVLEALGKVAERFGRSLAELELAWLASRPTVATVVASARTVADVRRNIDACSWELDDQTLDEIDLITAPEGVPSPERLRTLAGHWMRGDIRHQIRTRPRPGAGPRLGS